MKSNYHAWASGFLTIAGQNAERPQLAHQFTARLAAMRPDIALVIAKVIFESDHRIDITKLSIPTLVLQCRDDVAVPIQVGEYLARNISHATLKMIDAKGHLPHWSTPEQVTNAVRAFAE